MKKIKRNLIILFIIAGFFIMLREIYCMVIYFYNISIKRGNKLFLTRLIDLRNETEALIEDYEIEKNRWYNNTEFIDKYIESFDKISLYGRIYINKQKTDKWVITVHGFGGNGAMMDYAGRMFSEMGFNVLVPDCRGHGKSGGEFISMGWYDRYDIFRWCSEIKKINKNACIYLYGVSMGAATVLLCGGEKNISKDIKGIIADCGYTTVYDILKVQLKGMNVPYFPLLDIVSMVCTIKNGFGFRQVSVVKAVKRCDLPILFIHGEKDNFVPLYMMKKLYRAKKGIKKKLVVKGAGHGVCALRNPVLYWRKVKRFITAF